MGKEGKGVMYLVSLLVPRDTSKYFLLGKEKLIEIWTWERGSDGWNMYVMADISRFNFLCLVSKEKVRSNLRREFIWMVNNVC